MKRFDLEERLISFSTRIIEIVKAMPNDKVGSNLSNQLVRSGTSVSLNYGEAQSGESRRDFIHKIKIVLKELRETFICLKLIKRTHLLEDESVLDKVLDENDQLIAIFVKSVDTAQRNNENESKK
ncbi:MAG: four helix bundle protein [Candidatus Neomarinimicrobiota bacterium]